MTPDAEFCREQAAAERAKADAAELEHARQRSLKSADSWDALAARADGVERRRSRLSVEG